MKHFLLPLATLLFFANRSNAQFMVSVGNDTTACQSTTLVLFVDFPGTTPSFNMLYEWTPSTGITTPNGPQFPNFQIDSTITYILKVTDLVLVDSAYDTITITALPNPTTSFFASDTIACPGFNVAFTSTSTGGTPPYTYTFGFGDGSGELIPSPNHAYTQPGIYQPWQAATDANGCIGEYYYPYNISVSQPNVFTLLSPVTCSGGSDGSMNAIISGGIAPYFFSWSNGANTPIISNLSAGTYSVTVIDGHQCAATGFNIITEPAQLIANTYVANESSAGACDGLIIVEGSGGTPPYIYNWSNGNTTDMVSILCVGNYSLTLTDANGCTASGVGIIDTGCTVNTLAVSISSLYGDINCTHSVDTLTLNVSGGTPPYTYFWWTTPQAYSQELIVNQPGNYVGGVTDVNGCQRLEVYTISDSFIIVALTGSTAAGCNGNPNGSLQVTASGGTPPYTYLWSNNSTTDSIVNAAPGVYVLTVTDAASCSVVTDFAVGQTNADWSYYVYAFTSDANCGNTGTATATVYGGTAPFTYLWNYNNDTAQTITGLAPGTYTVTVTGANGCTRMGAAYVSASCYNVVTGYAFNDTNGNCIKDGNETTVGGMYVIAQSAGNAFYGYSDNTGYYSIQVPVQGAFNVSLSSSGWAWGNCSAVSSCPAQTITFGSLGDTTTANFGIASSSTYNLGLHPGWSSANPGFQKDYWVLYSQSSIPLYTGPAVITFTYDSILVYISCTNGGIHNVTNHTVTWNLATVPQQWVDWALRPMAYFTVPANTPVGYQLTQDFLITPISGDCDTSDNHLAVTEPVTGSMDPNEKQVSPAGDIQEQDSVLTYTIHFQNTGNDTTYFVILKDTLSPHLEPASVNNLSSSHAYTSFNVSENGILTWLFNPIFLVDSATNEPASKGFVMFKVKKKAGLPLNTDIKNTAHIYFDYNEPVVTNTVSSKLTDPTYIHNITNDAAIQVTAAPNPFTQQTQLMVEGITGVFNFELFDVSGKLLQKKNGLTDSRFAINREGMSAGVYFYSITTGTKQKAYGRLMVQ